MIQNIFWLLNYCNCSRATSKVYTAPLLICRLILRLYFLCVSAGSPSCCTN